MPTSLRGAKTWSMAIAEKRTNVMEMKYLRSSCGVTCMDPLVLQQSWLVEQNSVLRWFGHMKRIEKDRLVKRIVESDVRCEIERKTKEWMDGWMDGIKRALNERGMKDDCA